MLFSNLGPTKDINISELNIINQEVYPKLSLNAKGLGVCHRNIRLFPVHLNEIRTLINLNRLDILINLYCNEVTRG